MSDMTFPSIPSHGGHYPAAADKDAGGRVQHATSIRELRHLERSEGTVPISEEQFVKALERALKAMQGPVTMFEYAVHKDTNQMMVKVLDKETGELIREIPPEKMLDLVAHLWEMAGLFVDERR